MTRLLVFLIVAAIIGVASRLPAAPAPAKDSLSIDQKDFEIVGWVDKTATRAHAIDLTLNVKYSLVSQLKGYLRAAINLENETSFRSVFATEIGRGDNAQPIKLTIDKPKQKILRVIVWIDRDSPTAAPHPIVSDNIAFDAKVFLNINDR